MKIRISNKKRAALLLAALVFIFCALIFNVNVTAAGGEESQKPSYVTHSVSPGETLWSIARRYNEKSGRDIREYIYMIQQANDMKTASVYAGNSLIIPLD